MKKIKYNLLNDLISNLLNQLYDSNGGAIKIISNLGCRPHIKITFNKKLYFLIVNTPNNLILLDATEEYIKNIYCNNYKEFQSENHDNAEYKILNNILKIFKENLNNNFIVFYGGAPHNDENFIFFDNKQISNICLERSLMIFNILIICNFIYNGENYAVIAKVTDNDLKDQLLQQYKNNKIDSGTYLLLKNIIEEFLN